MRSDIPEYSDTRSVATAAYQDKPAEVAGLAERANAEAVVLRARLETALGRLNHVADRLTGARPECAEVNGKHAPLPVGGQFGDLFETLSYAHELANGLDAAADRLSGL